MAYLLADVEVTAPLPDLTLAPDEIFVSDGAKSDTGNIQEIFAGDSVVALTDPVYPVYVDSNVMAGRGRSPAGTMSVPAIVAVSLANSTACSASGRREAVRVSLPVR